ncbi:MAG: ABC transporter permease [Planctomycetaceae bacterium]|nr:ABC transporter permease [Planctomycetaceae bacterium]
MFIGPIFTRELVTAPRRWQHFVYRTLYGALLWVLIYTAWLVLAGTQIIRTVQDMAHFGSTLFLVLAPLQLALMTFLAATRSASAVAQEKDKKTMLLLLMTRLSNHELVLGKLLASLLDVLVMLASAVPIFMLLTLFGGVSPAQVGRVFLVTMATVLAAGSLGSTVALAREKTFQSLSMTALILVLWIGLWTAAGAFAGNRAIGGIPLAKVATAANPFLAVWTAAHPFRDATTAWLAGDTLFVIAALIAAGLLNGLAIWRLRVWNPGRETFQLAPTAEGGSIFGAPDEQQPTDLSPAEAARAGHVDARVRTIDQKSREVWDNPVLWRETCTWAYGRKVIIIRLAYLLLLILAAAGIYFTIQSGAAFARANEALIPLTVWPVGLLALVSLIIVNALAVTSITNERDGGSLDLLLVTDLSPKEFIFGKMLGVAWVTKEMLIAPLILCVVLWGAGALSLENLLYLLIGLAVMDLFVIMLGIHCGLNYASSKTAVGVSLGSVFFLFLGVVTLILFMISFSGSFQTQLAPFLAFIVGGSVGLFVTLGSRNPSTAIGLASLLLPFATLYAVTCFLVDKPFQVFFAVSFAYGFTTAALLVPAVYEFDVAMGRAKLAGEE